MKFFPTTGVVPAGFPVGRKASATGRRALIAMLAAAALAAAGCAHHYVITLTNGSQIATTSKPRLKNGEAYVYKDVQGKKVSIPAGRVSEIEPASMAKGEKGMFIPSGAN